MSFCLKKYLLSAAKLLNKTRTRKLSRHYLAARSYYSPYRVRDYTKRSRTRTPRASAIVCNRHSDGSLLPFIKRLIDCDVIPTR